MCSSINIIKNSAGFTKRKHTSLQQNINNRKQFIPCQYLSVWLSSDIVLVYELSHLSTDILNESYFKQNRGKLLCASWKLKNPVKWIIYERKILKLWTEKKHVFVKIFFTSWNLVWGHLSGIFPQLFSRDVIKSKETFPFLASSRKSICLHVFSSVACFVLKIEQFDFIFFHSAWHKSMSRTWKHRFSVFFKLAAHVKERAEQNSSRGS